MELPLAVLVQHPHGRPVVGTRDEHGATVAAGRPLAQCDLKIHRACRPPMFQLNGRDDDRLHVDGHPLSDEVLERVKRRGWVNGAFSRIDLHEALAWSVSPDETAIAHNDGPQLAVDSAAHLDL